MEQVIVDYIFEAKKHGLSDYEIKQNLLGAGWDAEIIEKTINVHYAISFDYKNMNKVMRVIKEKNLEIISQKMEMSCEIEIVTRKKNAEKIFDIFNHLFEIEIEKI